MSQRRLDQIFARCAQENRAALVGYLTAGDPTVALSEKLMLKLAASVDIIEIGMPFSDPAADGPVIQAASERALAAGAKMHDVFAIAAKVREINPDIGIIFMGYANVPYTLGFETFAKKSQTAGVDGVLLVDIPAEESVICAEIFRAHDLCHIMLLAPTSTKERIALAAKVGTGFIYYVSLAGITGAEMGAVAEIKEKLSLIRKYSNLPICVGFGIKEPKQARHIASFADGVVVGSHFVRQITANLQNDDAMIVAMHDAAQAMAVEMAKLEVE